MRQLQQPKAEDRELVTISEIEPVQTETPKASPSSDPTWIKDSQAPIFKWVPLKEKKMSKAEKKEGNAIFLTD